MPVSAPRPCRHPGCRALIHDGSGFCAEHLAVRRRESDRRRLSDDEVRKIRAWYKKPIWFARRGDCLKASRFCCATPGCVNRATDVDHITAHRGNWDLFISRENLQALCKPCHSRKTASEDGGFGNALRG